MMTLEEALNDQIKARCRLARQVGYLTGTVKQGIRNLRRGADAQLVADVLESMLAEMEEKTNGG